MMNLFAAPSAIQKLTIEITTLCNLKCAGCPRTMGIANDSWIDQHMDLQLFQRILEGWPETGFAIGRASCRERGCQYVSIWVVAVQLKKKMKGINASGREHIRHTA